MPRGIPNDKNSETMSSDPKKQPDLHTQSHGKKDAPDTSDLHLQRNTSTEKVEAQKSAQTNSRVDTNDLDTEKKSVSDSGKSRHADADESDIAVVGAAGAGDYARDLAFFEELVEVEVHESTDPNAEAIVDLYCNGVPQRFARGVPVTVKRKYLQILATSKPQTISTQANVQGQDVVNRITKHAALRYPFRVTRDDNPKGAEWLRGLLMRG